MVEHESFNMANDFNNHFFLLTSSPTPLDSPVPLQVLNFFRALVCRTILPHYNPSQVFPLPFIPHLSPSTNSKTYTQPLLLQKLFLLRKNMARIITREVITVWASSPSIFDYGMLLLFESSVLQRLRLLVKFHSENSCHI